MADRESKPKLTKRIMVAGMGTIVIAVSFCVGYLIWLNQNSARVTQFVEQRGGSVRTVDYFWRRVPDSIRDKIPFWPQYVEGLEFTGDNGKMLNLTPAEMDEFATLCGSQPWMENLVVTDLPFKPKHLQQIQRASSITSLRLDARTLSAQELYALNGLYQLKFIELHNVDLRGPFFDHFDRWKDLHTVHTEGCNWNGETIRSLTEHQTLKELWCEDSGVDGGAFPEIDCADLMQLLKLKNLQHVWFVELDFYKHDSLECTEILNRAKPDTQFEIY